jgi:hypothetical protein
MLKRRLKGMQLQAGLPSLYCLAVSFVLFSGMVTAVADGIQPGLWRIIGRLESNGVMGPPRESEKCLTPEQTQDVATTFSPLSRTINSECAPIERNFADGKLTWKLICKGQLDVELAGDFTFDSPRHYSAVVHTRATMAGAPTIASVNTLDAEWVSECP